MALRDITLRHGGTYTAAAVGEVNVVNEMKRTLLLSGVKATAASFILLCIMDAMPWWVLPCF